MFSMNVKDEEFINRPGGRDAGAGLWAVLIFLIAVFVGFIAWAAVFEIEEVTRASGRVVPSSQVQAVQSLEGGIVTSIEADEGEVVQIDQILFQIDDTSVQSSLGELEKRAQALSAELVRLRAEASGAGLLVFPASLNLNRRLIEAETAVFETRKRQLVLELDVLRDRLAQRRAELSEIDAQMNRLRAVSEPLRREIEISEGLFESGSLSEIEILRLRGDWAELTGDLLIFEATKARVEASIAEVDTQIRSVQSSYGLAAQERIAVILSDLAVVEETILAARDRVTRTALRSPVHGTVNRINVPNVGAVVQPGMVVAEVVPLDDSLLIEAEVSPRDVAFVRVGAEASVKISAFDYLRYGDLPARVERIGADALQSQDGVPFFQVMLRTEKTALDGEDGPLEISPGMMAGIDIQSGQKTVLEYLVQPVLRAQHEALRER